MSENDKKNEESQNKPSGSESELKDLLFWMQQIAEENEKPGQWPRGITLHLDGGGYIDYGTWNSSPGQYQIVRWNNIDELRELIRKTK